MVQHASLVHVAAGQSTLYNCNIYGNPGQTALLHSSAHSGHGLNAILDCTSLPHLVDTDNHIVRWL